MTDKFIFFENLKTTADKLPDDLRLKFYDALTDYIFKGIEPDDAVISALITAFKPSLDKVENRGGARDGAGKPKNSLDNEDNQNNSKIIKDNQNNSKIIKDNQNNSNELKKEKNAPVNPQENKKIYIPPITPNGVLSPQGDDTPLKKFIKPKIEEIITYCRERNNSVDAERFWNFYESKGWKVGKNPMKDWRAAVRTWERDDYAGRGANTQKQTDEEFYRQLEAM